eukprot:1290898-Alexandrium_andersonii.AAC.1
MSASLVGSEMCIRDRSVGAIAYEHRDLVHLRANIAAAIPLWDGAFPVSYTHLTLPTICSV